MSGDTSISYPECLHCGEAVRDTEAHECPVPGELFAAALSGIIAGRLASGDDQPSSWSDCAEDAYTAAEAARDVYKQHMNKRLGR